MSVKKVVTNRSAQIMLAQSVLVMCLNFSHSKTEWQMSFNQLEQLLILHSILPHENDSEKGWIVRDRETNTKSKKDKKKER